MLSVASFCTISVNVDTPVSGQLPVRDACLIQVLRGCTSLATAKAMLV